MECPACNVEMEPLVEGIFQCPQCKKIVKQKDAESHAKEKGKIGINPVSFSFYRIFMLVLPDFNVCLI